MHFPHGGSRWAAVIGMSLLLGLSACQSATVTPVSLPDAQTELNKAAQTIRNTKFIKIKLQLSGAPSFVDPPSNKISFISADGLYAAPDKVSANVKASVSVISGVTGVTGDVDVTTVGDCQWYKNAILTGGQYINKVFSPGFNAAHLVSSDAGIESALKAIKDLKMIGRESLFGADVYHLTGTADGKDIEALTVGLIRGKVVNTDIYIDTATDRAVEAVLVQPDTVTARDPKPTRWDLELFDYDVPVTISVPNVPAAPETPNCGQAVGAGTAQVTSPATSAATSTAAPPTITLTPSLTITGTLPTSTIPVPSDVPTATLPIPTNNAAPTTEATAAS